MEEKHWMAIYTKPRSEKKVAERLSERGFEVYCPLQTTIRQWSDRKKKVKIPIFPSYVFVCVTEKQRMEVLQDTGVLNFVFNLGKPAVIKKEEIETIKQFISLTSLGSEIFINQYKKGDKVDIIAGPFKELKGTIEELGKTETTLLIESLGIIIRMKTPIQYIRKER